MSTELESRVQKLEAAILLDSNAKPPAATPAANSKTVDETARALARANYRILHLTRGLEAALARAEAAEAKLAALEQK
jgi:hypothetical protein